jgi:predicted phosphoribosyltransferase
MHFTNRLHAARQLAYRLEHYKNQEGVILAIPRGGVPIGYYLSKYLGFPLDLLMAKRINHPQHEEYAIGAVGLEDSNVEESFTIPRDYVEKEIARIRQQLQERYHQFMGDHTPADLYGKTVIIVDDGITTGRTILSTLQMLRKKKPARLVVAVPVASSKAAERIRKEVEDFVCLLTPFLFQGVSRFYQDFSQVKDEEVMSLLQELNKKEGRNQPTAI